MIFFGVITRLLITVLTGIKSGKHLPFLCKHFPTNGKCFHTCLRADLSAVTTAQAGTHRQAAALCHCPRIE